jgi:hypothetical protein
MFNMFSSFFIKLTDQRAELICYIEENVGILFYHFVNPCHICCSLYHSHFHANAGFYLDCLKFFSQCNQPLCCLLIY